MIEVLALVLAFVIALAALVVAYAIVRYTSDAAIEQRDRDLLHVEKLEAWVGGERTEQRQLAKDERESFKLVKDSLYGTLEAMRRRAADAEALALNQNQQIHALLSEREFRAATAQSPPQPEQNGRDFRAVRGLVTATPIPDDNVEGTGDGGN